MPWRCPACSTQIRHADAEERPRSGIVYRCHVCHLELTLEEETSVLNVTPLRDVADDAPPKDKGRTSEGR